MVKDRQDQHAAFPFDQMNPVKLSRLSASSQPACCAPLIDVRSAVIPFLPDRAANCVDFFCANPFQGSFRRPRVAVPFGVSMTKLEKVTKRMQPLARIHAGFGSCIALRFNAHERLLFPTGSQCVFEAALR